MMYMYSVYWVSSKECCDGSEGEVVCCHATHSTECTYTLSLLPGRVSEILANPIIVCILLFITFRMFSIHCIYSNVSHL